MLVKTISRKTPSYGQLISYLCSAPDSEILGVWHLRGISPQRWEQQFQRDDQLRISPLQKGRSNRIVHHILSFSESSSEHLSSRVLKRLTDEYIRLKGLEVQGLAVVHRSEAHVHVHLMENGVARNGYANRVSRGRYAEIKQELQTFQHTHYPELADSLVEHGKGRGLNRSAILKRSQKVEIAALLKHGFGEGNSFSALQAKLKEHSCRIYDRGGQPSGIMTADGRKYRFRRLGIERKEVIRMVRKERYLQSLRLKRSQAQERSMER